MICRFEPIEIVPVQVSIFGGCVEIPGIGSQPIKQRKTVSVIKGTEEATRLLYERVFKLEAEQCKKSEETCIAAVPDWWQVRPGADRSQLTIQYARQKPPGSTQYQAPKYLVTVPHPMDGIALDSLNLSPYKKGQIMGVLTLRDNSKLIVNCETAEEVERVISELSTIIDPTFLTGLPAKIGPRGGENLDQITVEPKIIKLFLSGQKNLRPDDIHYID